jgi:hypothetical protein
VPRPDIGARWSWQAQEAALTDCKPSPTSLGCEMGADLVARGKRDRKRRGPQRVPYDCFGL